MFNIKNKSIILFFSIIIIFTSCDNLIIPYLEVTEVKIENNQVEVILSAEPNQNKFINSFGFYEDDSPVKGEYVFKSKTVYFSPKKNISEGHDYSVEISTDLEDTKGHSLQYDFLYTYTTKTESDPPLISSVSPENETEIRNKDYIPRIVFSESVERKSFSEAFSIVPNISYLLQWADDNTYVDIFFEKELTKNTQYTMTISTSLKDLQNNKLRNEYKTNFYYCVPQNQEKDFCYTFSYTNENSASKEMQKDKLNELSKDVIFQLDFSNCVSEDSISSYVSSYPSLKFNFVPDWETSKCVKFTLNETPEWNKEYLITIKKNITDEFSQIIEESVDYHVIFNKEKDRPVEFVKGFFLRAGDYPLQADKYFHIMSDNIYKDLNLYIENGGDEEQNQNVDKKLVLYAVFRISDEATGLNIPSLLEGVRISSTNSCIGLTIDSYNILTTEEYYSSPVSVLSLSNEDVTSWNLVYTKFNVSVTIYAQSGLIRFSFDEDISDNIGNSMNESLVFSYNKT